MTTVPIVPPDSRIKVAPSVYARAFGEEIILLEFHRGEYFGLDAIGAEVWRLLEGGSTITAAVDAIVARYEVSRDEAMNDVARLVGDMQASHLVTLESAR